MRNESEDCGIHLVPISVSKSKGVEQGLRKEIKYLTILRQEYELNMLEVKKELLDEKELQLKVDNLMVENVDMNRKLEKLEVQVSALRQEKEKPKAAVRSLMRILSRWNY